MRGCPRGPFDQDKYLEPIVNLEAQIQRTFESSTFRHSNFYIVLVPFDKISDALYVAIIEDRCCLLKDLLTLVDCSARLVLCSPEARYVTYMLPRDTDHIRLVSVYLHRGS